MQVASYIVVSDKMWQLPCESCLNFSCIGPNLGGNPRKANCFVYFLLCLACYIFLAAEYSVLIKLEALTNGNLPYLDIVLLAACGGGDSEEEKKRKVDELFGS